MEVFPFSSGEHTSEAACYIQEHWHAHKKVDDASRRIQAALHGHEARHEAHVLRAIVHIQRAARRADMRRKLRRLSLVTRSSAAEVGARSATTHAWPGVSLIQLTWRAHFLRRRWHAILERLHEMHPARRPSQSQPTPAVLIRRERLWRNDKVQQGLDRAWEAVAGAIANRSGERGDERGLSWAAYHEMSQKVHALLVQRTDPRTAFFLAKADFAHDTRYWADPATPLFQRRLSREDFNRSWFELACTDDLDEEDALEDFIEETAHALVKRDPDTGAYVLRSDAEIIAIARDRSRTRRARALREGWVRHAPPADQGARHYLTPTAASLAAQRPKFKRVALPPWELARRAAQDTNALEAAGRGSFKAAGHGSSRALPEETRPRSL
jgi:hypothetical protein